MRRRGAKRKESKRWYENSTDLGANPFRLWMGGILLFFFCGYLGLIFSFQGELPETDLLEINRIYQEVLLHWEKPENLKGFQAEYDFRVIDQNGRELCHFGEAAPHSVYEAVRKQEAYFLLSKEGSVSGAVLIATNLRKLSAEREVRLKTSLFVLFFIMTAMIGFYFFYLNRMILKPFQKLEQFSKNIAQGNLEAPLLMDKKNIFGAFTQSFDIMREELMNARKKEALASQEKKELVASLSHDIKTPVTAIKLMSELLLVQVKEEKIRKKVASIYDKAEQINRLITDLFESALEELGEMKTEPEDNSSTRLGELFAMADYAEKLTIEEIPECLIRVDLDRLSQVIGNIIYNSYKYAGTEISVSFEQLPNYLRVIIRDFGSGVKEEELPFIFQKFYRGKEESVQKQKGAGLGLYIAKSLMLKMEGDIFCQNVSGGFEVSLLIPVC